MRTRREHGSALVELALLSLVLVPMLLYAVYLTELAQARIDAHAGARLLAWETAARGLSDWHGGAHPAYGEAQARAALAAARRVADGPPGSGSGRAQRAIATERELDEARTQATLEPPHQGTASALLQGLAPSVQHYGFNAAGAVRARWSIKVRNVLLGRFHLPRFSERLLTLEEQRLESEQLLIADVWDLKDGRGVVELEGVDCGSDYCRQVARMAGADAQSFDLARFAALERRTAALGGQASRAPLAASVASLPLDGRTDAARWLEVARIPGHTPLCKHLTNSYKDTFAHRQSRYARVYERLGPHFLGCREPLRQEGTCLYESRPIAPPRGVCP